MDFENVEKLGQVPTKYSISQNFNSLGSTVSVSHLGDLLLLGADGRVYYSNIRQANRSQSLTSNDNKDNSYLPIEGLSAEEVASNYSELLVNSEGTIIALWSKENVGILEIPAIYTKDGLISPTNTEFTGENESCRFIPLLHCSDSSNNNNNKIVKVQFHPLNPNSLVILRERESLTFIDLRNYSKEDIHLPKTLSFTSFTFGCNNTTEWFQFTLFLTTQTNEIYYLCPIIPTGTVLSKAVIAELLAWIIEHEEVINERLLDLPSTSHQGNLSKTGNKSKKNESEEEKLHELRQYFKYSYQYLLQRFGKTTITQMKNNLLENPSYYENNSSLPSSSSLLDSYLTAESDDMAGFSLSDYFTTFPNTLQGRGKVLDEEGEDDDDDDDAIEFKHVRIALQGPISVLRSKKQQELIQSSDSLHDINMPSMPTKFTGMMAPLLVTVQSNGLTEILLFDIVDENLWLLGPAWRPLASTSILQYLPTPSLVVADHFAVKSFSSSNETAHSLSDSYHIIPDPVFSHYFYCVNKRQGEVFLLVSNWLQETMNNVVKLMEELEESGEGEGVAEEKENNALVSSMTSSSSSQLPSECFPLFQNEDAVEEHRGVNGIQVVKDPFVGHVLIIHTDFQEFMVINVTTHLKLCQLQTTLQDEPSSKEMNAIQQQLDHYSSNEHLRYRKSQQLILQIAEGLQTLPKLEIFLTKENKEIPKSEAQNKKELIETAQLLEKRVITPLRALLQNLFFHVELIEGMYQVQHDILFGKREQSLLSSGTANAGETSMTTTTASLENFSRLSSTQQKELLLSIGVKGILQILSKENQLLNQRIQSIQSKNEEMKDELDRYLRIFMNARKTLTKNEKLYQEQLEEWMKYIPKLTKEIETMKQLYMKQKLLLSQSSSSLLMNSQKLDPRSHGNSEKKALPSPHIPMKPSTGKTGFPFNLPAHHHHQPQGGAKPIFARGVQPLVPLGSPLGSPVAAPPSTTTASAASTTSTLVPGKIEAKEKEVLGVGGGGVSFGSPSLSFNTTLGSNLFGGNKSFTKNPFGTTIKPAANTSSLLDSSNISAPSLLLTPKEKEDSKVPASTDTPLKPSSEVPPETPVISSEAKKSMTLNDLASAEKAESNAPHSLQIELSAKDKELCFDLLKSQEEMIHESKQKVIALERKLQHLRKLQQQQQLQNQA